MLFSKRLLYQKTALKIDDCLKKLYLVSSYFFKQSLFCKDIFMKKHLLYLIALSAFQQIVCFESSFRALENSVGGYPNFPALEKILRQAGKELSPDELAAINNTFVTVGAQGFFELKSKEPCFGKHKTYKEFIKRTFPQPQQFAAVNLFLAQMMTR